MAVSIDTVYQRVLSILNKEQRGYVTPQEFNLFANQAQLDLFEQYFYDINQFGRLPGNDTEYSDMLKLLDEKISIFETRKTNLQYNFGSNGTFILPDDLYRLGTVIYKNSTTKLILDPAQGPETPQTTIEEIEVERINANEFLYINSSPLTKPRNVRPLYVADYRGLKVYGDVEITADIDLTYVKQPAKVEWKYQMVLGEALYDSSFSVNFELHASEETELVIKILELASLATKDLQVNQIATQEEIRNTQQEKS
jgi:hypothetical protein